jgi:hypothetical protein
MLVPTMTTLSLDVAEPTAGILLVEMVFKMLENNATSELTLRTAVDASFPVAVMELLMLRKSVMTETPTTVTVAQTPAWKNVEMEDVTELSSVITVPLMPELLINADPTAPFPDAVMELLTQVSNVTMVLVEWEMVTLNADLIVPFLIVVMVTSIPPTANDVMMELPTLIPLSLAALLPAPPILADRVQLVLADQLTSTLPFPLFPTLPSSDIPDLSLLLLALSLWPGTFPLNPLPLPPVKLVSLLLAVARVEFNLWTAVFLLTLPLLELSAETALLKLVNNVTLVTTELMLPTSANSTAGSLPVVMDMLMMVRNVMPVLPTLLVVLAISSASGLELALPSALLPLLPPPLALPIPLVLLNALPPLTTKELLSTSTSPDFSKVLVALDPTAPTTKEI